MGSFYCRSKEGKVIAVVLIRKPDVFLAGPIFILLCSSHFFWSPFHLLPAPLPFTSFPPAPFLLLRPRVLPYNSLPQVLILQYDTLTCLSQILVLTFLTPVFVLLPFRLLSPILSFSPRGVMFDFELSEESRCVLY